MAIGVLYRCRRAIVVGDPKQVEPVVTSEMDVIKRIIRNDENILYQSKSHSVQEFADRINPIGAYFTEPSEERSTWVGCPLVVHRRCISPMYEISNSISYNNTMKQQTQPPEEEKEASFCLESSRWINICGTTKDGKSKNHYVETQGERAIELVKIAFEKTTEIPSLYIISPFISVKNGFIQALKKLPEYKNKDKRMEKWAKTHIGTVHTFQGKEANEVVFLLGCDKNSLSAVRWVNNNIVNVAVTRAKFRLYIIGDYNTWQHSFVMQKVKCIMDSYAIRALHSIAAHPVDKKTNQQVKTLLKQIPPAESFQLDDVIEDVMIGNFQNALSDIWANEDELSEEQLNRFKISKSSIEILDPQVKRNILWGIKLYYLFNSLQEKHDISEMDFSCAGIMFCKAMELHLKDCLLPGFQEHFPSLKTRNGKLLSHIEKKDAMIGTFTFVLNDLKRQEILAQKQISYKEKICDPPWWKQYHADLESFRVLRNSCCHPENFNWDDVRSLLNNLFWNEQFFKTLVGKML